MNRTHTLMTLLVISLVAGPFLFAVPTVYAVNPNIDPVIVRINESSTSPTDSPWNGLEWNEFFDITIVEDPPPVPDPSWKPIGDTYDVTVKEDFEEALYDYLVENAYDVEIWLLVENKYKNRIDELSIIQYDLFCDFDGDGRVTGHDSRIISNHMHNPGSYTWFYDLDQDGDIDTDDIHIADSFKGSSEQWIEISSDFIRVEYIGSNPYLIADIWHFSYFRKY